MEFRKVFISHCTFINTKIKFYGKRSVPNVSPLFKVWKKVLKKSKYCILTVLRRSILFRAKFCRFEYFEWSNTVFEIFHLSLIWDFFSKSQKISEDKNIISHPPTVVGVYFSNTQLTYPSHTDICWFEPTPDVWTVFYAPNSTDLQVRIYPLKIPLLNVIIYGSFEAEASWLRATQQTAEWKRSQPWDISKQYSKGKP